MYSENIAKDVLVKVYHIDHGRSGKLFEHSAHLQKLRSDYLLHPIRTFSWKMEYWMVFPYFPGRRLSDLIVHTYTDGIKDSRLLARVLLDVLTGLADLHREQIVHRNLYPHSLHYVKDTGVTMVKNFTNVKFFTRDDSETTCVSRWQGTGTDIYCRPPELLGKFALGESERTIDQTKSDIFLFGITALNLAMGAPPPSISNMKTLQSTWQKPSISDYKERPGHISNPFLQMVNKCLAHSTEKRPSAVELMKDSFFSQAAPHKEIKTAWSSLIKVDMGRENQNVPASVAEKTISSPVSIKSVQSWDFSGLPRSDSLATKPSGSRLDVIEEATNPPSLPHLNSSGPVTQHDRKASIIGRAPPSAHSSYNNLQVLTEEIMDASPHASPPNLNDSGLRVNASHIDSDMRSDRSERFVVTDSNIMGDGVSPQNNQFSPPVQFPRSSPEYHDADMMKTDTDEVMGSPLQTSADALESTTPRESSRVTLGRFVVTNSQTPNQVSGNEAVSLGSNDQHQQQPIPVAVPAASGSVPPVRTVVMNSRVESAPASGEGTPAPLIDPTGWTVDDVVSWVQSLGHKYKDYTEGFIGNGIDGEMLKELDAEELEEMGVKQKLHRRKIMTALKKLFPDSKAAKADIKEEKT